MRSQSTHRIPLTMLMSLVGATAASCAQVEAEIPEARVTQKAVSFAGVPGGQAIGEVSISHSFTVTSEDLSWAANLNAEVYAYEVEIKATSGVADLGFIHYAIVTISDGAAGSTMPPVEVVNYERPDNYTPSPVLDVKTTQAVNVTDIWAKKKVVVTMQLAGVFPEQDWTADVTLHLSGKISYKL
jgi:hypothetical protein